MHRFFDPAGSDDGSRKRRRRCCLPLHRTASAPRSVFTRLNSPACAYPYRRFAAALASGRRTARGHRDSLDLRCRAFSSPSPSRVIPALSLCTDGSLGPFACALHPATSVSRTNARTPAFATECAACLTPAPRYRRPPRSLGHLGIPGKGSRPLMARPSLRFGSRRRSGLRVRRVRMPAAMTRPKRAFSQPRRRGGACRTSEPSGSIAISSRGSNQIAKVLSPTASASSFRIRDQSAWSDGPGTPSVRRTSSRLTLTRRWRFRPLPVV